MLVVRVHGTLLAAVLREPQLIPMPGDSGSAKRNHRAAPEPEVLGEAYPVQQRFTAEAQETARAAEISAEDLVRAPAMLRD